MSAMTAAIWDGYWRTGHTHSCSASGVPVTHAEFWRAFFADCRPGARVLDLACGAGAVAMLAREADRGFVITGVDFATAIKPIDGVNLVLGAPAEELPFPDAAFDVVVSQYGFEYADQERAALELVRVLAPGGEAALIVHASEGPPVQDITGRLARGRRMLQPGGFADLLLRLAEAPVAGAATQSLVDAAEAARLAESRADHDDTTRRVLAILSDAFFLRRRFGGEHVRRETTAISEELKQYLQRLEAMTRAARSAAQAETLAGGFEARGLIAQPILPAKAANGDLTGWILRFSKPPA